MYAPVPPPTNNDTPATAPHHQPSAASTTTCRVHALNETDHEGRVLVELVTREPNGARFVQQHRVPPNELEAFVRYHRQRCPSFTIERVNRNEQAAHHQQPTGFSTSSIGELSGYDKYGGSYGACTWSSTPQQAPNDGGGGDGGGGAGGAGC